MASSATEIENSWAPIFVEKASDEYPEDSINYIRITLNQFEIPSTHQTTDEVRYKIIIFFFDPTKRLVLGRLWQSEIYRPRRTTDGQLGIVPHEVLYVYSEDIQRNHFVVFELISLNSEDTKYGSSICWGAQQLLNVITSEKKSHMEVTPMYLGSSRSIFILQDLTIMKGIPSTKCSVYYSIELHPTLERCANLFPENTIISNARRIPGIDVSSGLKLGIQDLTTVVYLYNIAIYVDPIQLNNFEAEFCESLRENIVLRGNRVRSSSTGMPQVTERRLKIFYHNQYRAVEPIPLVLLDLCSENQEHALKRRHSSVPTALRQSLVTKDYKSSKHLTGNRFCLLARNPVQLTMPRDPDCVIVFVMEYVISDRGSEAQRRASSVASEMKATFTVRWGVYPIFTDDFIAGKEDYEGAFQVALRGTASDGESYPLGFYNLERKIAKYACPDGSLCFRHDTKCGMSLILAGEARIGRGMSQSTDLALETESQFAPMNESIQAQTVIDVNQAPRKKVAFRPPVATRVEQARLSLKKETDNLLEPCTTKSNELLAQQTLYSQMAQQTWGTQANFRAQNSTQPMGPFLGGQGPVMYEALQAAPIAPYAQLTRGVSGPISVVSHCHRGVGLSRAAYARLYRAGFSQISTESGEAPFTINPQEESDPAQTFKFNKEAADALVVNEIVLQFLAYSSYQDANEQAPAPKEVYFTFQFYRFPQITTKKLHLGKELDDFPDAEGLRCHILEQSQEGAKNAGYRIVITLDPTFLKPGEYETFFNYLLNDNLHFDVWDAKSHLLIGNAAVELKHLCRQGREAVQVTYALDVLSAVQTNDDCDLTTSDQNALRIQGRIHLRLANVGRHTPTPSAAIVVFNRKQRRFLITSDDQCGGFGFEGGALSNACLPRQSQVQGPLAAIKANSECRLVRARPLTEVSPELREMLQTARAERLANNINTEKKVATSARQQKLARLYTALQAVNGGFSVNDLVGYTTLSGVKVSGTDKALELRTICNYREQKKKEQIERMLSRAQIVEHGLETSFGCTEFFEFQLTNPHNQEETVRIDIEDSQNNTTIVTDPRETKFFKAALGIITPTEDDLFLSDASVAENASPQHEQKSRLTVFLRPKESVSIPIKYMESKMLKNQMAMKESQTNLPHELEINGKSLHKEYRTVQINFKSIATGKLISQLVLRIHINPAVIDQTFRFFHPELSYFKKLIRLPPISSRTIHSMNGYSGLNNYDQTAQAPASGHIWTRVSDPGILIESGSANLGEPTDLLVKVGLGNCPQVREFLVAVYLEPFQICPAYVWQWTVHALHRIDIAATIGLLSPPVGVLLRTEGLLPAGSARRIGIYTNRPQEVILGTESDTGVKQSINSSDGLSFLISPRAVYELKLRLCPRRVGLQNYQINAVDSVAQKVIRSWILCVDVKPPEVSKTFNVELPLIGRQNAMAACHKRIAYTNPYPNAKRLILQTDRPDLVQFKEYSMDVPAGGTVEFGLHFIPQQQCGVQRIYVFVKDDVDKIEETFSVVATYA